MLGEPHEVQSEPVEHDHLVHDGGVQARHVHARFRRVAEIVDGADAKGWTHDACSPLVRKFAGSAAGMARSRKKSRSFLASRASGPSARSRLSSAARPLAITSMASGWRDRTLSESAPLSSQAR